MQSNYPFADNDPEYKCCCGCCHVRTGTLVIGFFHALFLAAMFFKTSDEFFLTLENLNWFTVLTFVSSSVLCIWSVVAVIGVLVGVCCERPRWLLPKMAFQIFYLVDIVLLIGGLILLLLFWRDDFARSQYESQTVGNVSLNSTGDWDALPISLEEFRSQVTIWASVMIGIALVTFGVQFWFLLIIRACYRYLQDKNRWKRAGEQPEVGNRFNQLPSNPAPTYYDDPPPYASTVGPEKLYPTDSTKI